MAKNEIIVSVGQDYTSVIELMKEFDKQMTNPTMGSLIKECYAAFLIKTFKPKLEE